jgi:hypothetical protein
VVSALFTVQKSFGLDGNGTIGWFTSGAVEYIVVFGSMPSSTIAASSPYDLNVEPAWRRDCTARLYLLLS